MKKRSPIIIVLLLWTISSAQSAKQIRYRELVKMRVPVVGKIEMVSTIVVAHGMVHEKEESTMDRFVFRWMGNSEGSIIDLSNGYKISYDKEDEEYWHTTFEDLVEERVNQDTSIESQSPLQWVVTMMMKMVKSGLFQEQIKG